MPYIHQKTQAVYKNNCPRQKKTENTSTTYVSRDILSREAILVDICGFHTTTVSMTTTAPLSNRRTLRRSLRSDDIWESRHHRSPAPASFGSLPIARSDPNSPSAFELHTRERIFFFFFFGFRFNIDSHVTSHVETLVWLNLSNDVRFYVGFGIVLKKHRISCVHLSKCETGQ